MDKKERKELSKLNSEEMNKGFLEALKFFCVLLIQFSLNRYNFSGKWIFNSSRNFHRAYKQNIVRIFLASQSSCDQKDGLQRIVCKKQLYSGLWSLFQYFSFWRVDPSWFIPGKEKKTLNKIYFCVQNLSFYSWHNDFTTQVPTKLEFKKLCIAMRKAKKYYVG